MAVRLFKLFSGELVIAETDNEIVKSDGEKCIVVKRPLQMIVMKEGIALQMWIPCDLDQPVNIRLSHIIGDAAAVAGLAAEYQSKFNTSGLIKPPEPKLVIPD